MTDMIKDAEEKQAAYVKKRAAWQVGVEAKERARKAAEEARAKEEAK